MTGGLSAFQEVAVAIVPIVLAVTLHEAAHGYAAMLLGDPTARERGRVSLNPLRHVDPIGTVLFPALALLFHAPIFGWAKPVPVNFARLRHPKRDMIFVALAGPATNLLLLTGSLLLVPGLGLLPVSARFWGEPMLFTSVTINAFLAVFNLLPIPPLDGSRVAMGLLPRPLALSYARLEKFGLLIVIFLFVLAPALLGSTFDPFRFLVETPAMWLVDHLAALLGSA